MTDNEPLEEIKRFMVFEYLSYYPAGGLGDWMESFDSKEEAIEYAKKTTYDNTDIFDRIEGIIIDEDSITPDKVKHG